MNALERDEGERPHKMLKASIERSKLFQAKGSVNQKNNFFVEPPCAKDVRKHVEQGKTLVVVCGPRLSGKTTLAEYVATEVEGNDVKLSDGSDGELHCIVLTLTEEFKSEARKGLLHACQWFQQEWSHQAGDLFPESPVNSEAEFRALFFLRKNAKLKCARVKLALFIDEASELLPISNADSQQMSAMHSILQLFYALIHSKKDSALHCVTLLGVERFDRTIMSGELTRGAPVRAENCIFIAALPLHLCTKLLQQFVDERSKTEVVPLTWKASEVAAELYKRTGGHAGFFGAACALIAQRASGADQSLTTKEDVMAFLETAPLLKHIFDEEAYKSIVRTLTDLSEEESKMLLKMLFCGGGLPRLLDGGQQLTACERLLSEGLLVTEPFQTDNSNGTTAMVLAPCELLTSAIIMSLRLPASNSVDLPENGLQLDPLFLLKQACRLLAVENITVSQGMNLISKDPPQYAWQGELFARLDEVLRSAYPLLFYRLVAEARFTEAELVAGRKMQCSILAESHGLYPPHKFELLASASSAAVVEHIRRAGKFTVLHKDGRSTVVHICTTDAYDSTCYDEWPPCPEGVSVVHIRLDKERKPPVLTFLWGRSAEKEEVPITGSQTATEFSFTDISEVF